MNKELPPLWKMAWNATKAAIRAAKACVTGQELYLENEEIEYRLSICREPCSEYTVSDSGKERCSECGCFLDLKAPLTTEWCPLYKWPGDALRRLQLEQEEEDSEQEESP